MYCFLTHWLHIGQFQLLYLRLIAINVLLYTIFGFTSSRFRQKEKKNHPVFSFTKPRQITAKGSLASFNVICHFQGRSDGFPNECSGAALAGPCQETLGGGLPFGCCPGPAVVPGVWAGHAGAGRLWGPDCLRGPHCKGLHLQHARCKRSVSNLQLSLIYCFTASLFFFFPLPGTTPSLLTAVLVFVDVLVAVALKWRTCFGE